MDMLLTLPFTSSNENHWHQQIPAGHHAFNMALYINIIIVITSDIIQQ